MSDELVLDWGSEIENTGSEQEDFVVLPAGNYPFKIIKMEKEYYQAKEGSKIPSCPRAVLHMIVDGGDKGRSFVRENVYLVASMQWKIFSVFQCVGLVKKGEKKAMPWGLLEGSEGVAKIKESSFRGKDGEDHDKNEISSFLPYGTKCEVSKEKESDEDFGEY